ncbi:unnamed protein product [Nesidiocoris tenuis]|uniref:Uncharacterized protein n=1 Tax=Nesidiocoris tenuis TaxID=355587 RepID=A0A6H5HG09_9HEMI|nr:unnamed protein product [Nesidiocoris tenuis]
MDLGHEYESLVLSSVYHWRLTEAATTKASHDSLHVSTKILGMKNSLWRHWNAGLKNWVRNFLLQNEFSPMD